MTITTRHVTIAEYEALPDPTDGWWLELVARARGEGDRRGDWVESSP
ncbi:MAG: hypothetical protein M3462_06910 [Chloroflexota bacterium]|nr:hypothetical protein [Chloroflexota bacterium]